MRRRPARTRLPAVGIAVAATLLASPAGPVVAQVRPFDMTPERERLQIRPAPARPAPRGEAPAATPAEPRTARRPLVPFAGLTLAGEVAERAWATELTPEQARSAARLSVGFRNAVVVAPESSRLVVLVNGEPVIETPVGVSDRTGIVTADVRPGLLRAGSNSVRFRVEQRHRTDCSIQSTYELWTEIDQAATFLAFTDVDAGRLRRSADIAAIGVDAAGATRFEFVVPSLGQPVVTAPMLRLAQGLALIAAMPNQTVRVETRRDEDATAGPGHLVVALGTAAELGDVLSALPEGAGSRPVASFVDDPRLGPSTLVVTGPTWDAVQVAIEGVVGVVDRPPGTPRTALGMQSARIPDPPVFTGPASVTLADLGVTTQEFAGRRFRTDFGFALPADFYATAYGETTLLLDAAYTEAVLPGSHIDIYVNGNIAATVPITSSGGAILRQLPIGVTMRHMKPGLNEIAIEAILSTAADSACLPGTTALGDNRFVLFDTSTFVMPRFARIGQQPNLAALAGMGFPYELGQGGLPTLIGDGQGETMSAAATFFARLALAAGRPIGINAVASPAGIGNGSAVFVGTASQIPQSVLQQVGLPESLRAGWASTPQRAQPGGEAGRETAERFEMWRDRLAEGGWRGQVSSFEDWLRRTFDISFGTLRLMPGVQAAYAPPAGTTLIVAQNPAPGDGGVWTVVTAPSEAQLAEGVAAVTGYDAWRAIDGSISAYQAATGRVESREIGTFRFQRTQPTTFRNERLVIANWLSDNILAFSALLLAMSVLLGLSTVVLLRTLGRKPT